MKISCEIIQDLLPLYAEGIASEDSRKLVEEHLSECPSCKKQFTVMTSQSAINKAKVQAKENSLLLVKRELRKRKTTLTAFVGAIIFLVMVTVFAQLTAPRYQPFTKALVTITEKDDGSVYATFADSVTGWRATGYTDADSGKEVMEIEAWSTLWDRLTGVGPQTIMISSPEHPIDLVYYCANEEEAVVIYGTAPESGGMIVLPRLVLTYYVLIALAAAILLGILWLIFRKKGTAGNVIGYCALAPLSYLIGTFCIKGFSTASFSAMRDFIMILIAACAVYFVLQFGNRLCEQRRKDRLL
jgi:hypothetical protein